MEPLTALLFPAVQVGGRDRYQEEESCSDPCLGLLARVSLHPLQRVISDKTGKRTYAPAPWPIALDRQSIAYDKSSSRAPS